MNNKRTNKINKAEIIFGDYEGNGKCCIMLLYGGKRYVLFPTQLITMLIQKEGNLTASCKDGDVWNGNTVYYHDAVDDYKWLLSDYADKEAAYLVFPKDVIHKAIRDTFMQLKEALDKGIESIYQERSVTVEIMDGYVKELNRAIFISENKYYNYGSKVKEVQELDFDCKPESVDFPYTITLGHFKLHSYVSDWGTNLTQLRKDLEMSREIRLFFEDSPTIISFPDSYDDEDPYVVGNKMGVVKITANEFCSHAVIFGICLRRQVIKAIYEGLLRMARYEFKGIDYWGTWDNVDNITFYNKIKSPIVENFINDKYFENQDIELRQVRIEHILTISPDYDVLYYDEKSRAESFYDDGKIIVEVGGNDRKEILMPGFEEWHNEYIRATDFVECKTDTNFDYDGWEERGLKFAQMLREQLPDSIDLWYEPPFEDVRRKDMHAKLIYKNYKVLSAHYETIYRH